MKLKVSIRTFCTAAALAAVMAVSAYAYDVQGGTVTTASAVHFRTEANTESQSMGTLSDGVRVAVLGEADGWYQVAYDGQTGYMSANYIETQPIMNITCGGVKVETEVLNLRSGPGTENDVVAKLSQGSVAKIIGINNGWFKVQCNGKTGYVSPEYVSIVPYSGNAGGSASAGSSASASGTRQDIIDYAATLLGCKYVYGGTSPKGFDCSGFTQYVFNQFGVSLSHSSSAQYSNSTQISRSELQIGDLVFFSQKKGSSKVGHVGIYVGDNDFIHSASPGSGVQYDSMDSTYYSTHYIGCGRVLSD